MENSNNLFLSTLQEKQYLLLDGATGTNLFDMGLVSGNAPEVWNDEFPDRIFDLNVGFVNAGSDIILTNSFGGNAMRLKLHQNAHRVAELNEKAAQIAKKAANQGDKKVFVAGSIGPLGELLEPIGDLSMDEATQAFTEQALALERGGCDLLWIETLSSKEELIAAAEGVSQTNLLYGCCGSFDTKGRTMMGITPAKFAEHCLELSKPPVIVGSNCGVGPAQTVAATMEMADAFTGKFSFVAKANCGIPEWVGANIRYSASPEQMHTYAHTALDAGARIVGGCCGTQFEHVREMRRAFDSYVPGDKPTIEQISTKLGEVIDSTPKKKTGRRRRPRRR